MCGVFQLLHGEQTRTETPSLREKKRWGGMKRGEERKREERRQEEREGKR